MKSSKSLVSIIGFVFGLSLSLLLARVAGESPVAVLKIILNSAFGSRYDLGLTLFYATHFIFTGLSVSVAFQSGLFNIGAEGQLTVATMAAAITGIVWPSLPFPLGVIVGLMAAILMGGLWGFIPGLLKAKRGAHEVIVTMMLNFVAAGLTSYLTLNYFKNPNSQNPETAPIGSGAMLAGLDPVSRYFTDSPANISLIVALVLCAVYFLFMNKTIWGYELRAVGQNELASQTAGINILKNKILAMTLAGVFAGFVALNEINGSSGKFKMGFSAEYGFVGIAVALMSNTNPLGIVLTAFLFGVLQKGTLDLSLESQFITKDFARIMQAVIILGVVGAAYFESVLSSVFGKSPSVNPVLENKNSQTQNHGKKPV